MLEAKLRRLERQERERHATASSMPGVNQRTPFALLTGDVSLLVVEPPTPPRPRDTTTGGNQRTPVLRDTASALHRWLDETVLDEAVRDHRNALAAGPKTSRPPTPPTPVLGRSPRCTVAASPPPAPAKYPSFSATWHGPAARTLALALTLALTRTRARARALTLTLNPNPNQALPRPSRSRRAAHGRAAARVLGGHTPPQGGHVVRVGLGLGLGLGVALS